MEPDEIIAFATATAKLKKHPSLIWKPELAFFQEYLLSCGVKLPSRTSTPVESLHIDLIDSDDEAAAASSADATPASSTAANLASKATGSVADTKVSEASNIAASDEAKEKRKSTDKETGKVEALDIADSDEEDAERLPEDPAPYPELPALPLGEADEAQQALCSAAKQAAAEALEAGNIELSLAKYTEAIMSGAASALLFARRGELLLQQSRPCAAIFDCTAALEVNPDCGKAYRIRGLAERKLGRWEAAHRDLLLGQKLDYDEATVQIQQLVAQKAKQAEERRAAAEARPNIKRRRAK